MISDLMHTHRLLGGFECVHLYPHNEMSTESNEAAFRAGFIVPPKDEYDHPVGSAYVDADGLYVATHIFASEWYYIGTHQALCLVAARKKPMVELRKCRKEDLP